MGIRAALSSTGRGSAIVGFASVTLLAAYIESSAANRVTHGFIAYYAAARLLITGDLGPQVYDDGWFGVYVQKLTQSGVREIFGPNPPTMALTAIPFAMLDHAAARHVWLMASLACQAIAVAALSRFAPSIGFKVPAALVAVLLLNPAVFANLRTGQAYIFLLALLTISAIALLRGRDRLAGLSLGLALLLKSSGLALLLIALTRRRWRMVLTATMVAAAGSVLVAALIDPATWRAYLSYVPEFVARPAASTTAYQTTLGLVRRLCVADPVWNPSPAANCAAMSIFIPALMLGAALLVTIALAAHAAPRLWVAAGICLSELTLPIAEEEHFVLFGIPLVLLWPSRRSSRVVLALAAALLLVPLDYTAHRFTSGWWALLAYPRLYSAWLVWAVASVEMLRDSPPSAVRTTHDA